MNQQTRCECGETTDLLHDCDRKEREAECPCIMRDPENYDGPMEDCPQHGRCSVQSTDGRRCLKDTGHRHGGWSDDPHVFGVDCREKYDERGEMLTSLEGKLHRVVKERDDLSRALQRIEHRIRNGESSDATLVLAIRDIVKEVQRERENTAFANEHADRFYERATAAEGENARLYADLESTREHMRGIAEESAQRKATIARVRAWTDTTEHGAAAAQVRAALKGER